MMKWRKKFAKSPEEKRKEDERMKEVAKRAMEEIQAHYDSPEDVLELANFMANFHNYSLNNTALIQAQFPNAYAVAGFNHFKKQGFHVLKGEKSKISVRAGIKYQYIIDKNNQRVSLRDLSKEQRERLKGSDTKIHDGVYYKWEKVFDISQTNAKPEDLPKIFPNRQWNFEVTEENKEVLQEGIRALAKAEGIEIRYGEDRLLGTAKGAYVQYEDGRDEIAMNKRNTETQQIATSIHELAHAKLHKGKAGEEKSNPTKEFEAELTSYIVCKYYGMDTSNKAIPYIAAWTKNGEALEEKDESMKLVQNTARAFIRTIDSRMMEVEKERQQTKKVVQAVQQEQPQEIEEKQPEPVPVPVVEQDTQVPALKEGDIVRSNLYGDTASYQIQKIHENNTADLIIRPLAKPSIDKLIVI